MQTHLRCTKICRFEIIFSRLGNTEYNCKMFRIFANIQIPKELCLRSPANFSGFLDFFSFFQKSKIQNSFYDSFAENAWKRGYNLHNQEKQK